MDRANGSRASRTTVLGTKIRESADPGCRLSTELPLVEVETPVQGWWVPLNSPAERIPSHGTDLYGQRYAYDLVQYDEELQSFSTRPLWHQFFGLVRAESFLCWNQPVFACFDGEIIASANDWPDRLKINTLLQSIRAHWLERAPIGDDFRSLLGNHVIIGGHVGFALYAHLRKNSICVTVGQRVRRGDLLGTVGNSGNSTQPHLHFHLMDRPSPRGANGIFCSFRNCESQEQRADSERGLVPNVMAPFRARIPREQLETNTRKSLWHEP